jgi:hypothetical protein
MAGKRGFALGDNAAVAARKNHALGTAHQWSSDTATAAGRKGAAHRWSARGSALTEHARPATPKCETRAD